MRTQQLWAVVIYLGAILIPAGAMAARFGFETNIVTENSAAALTQILSMGGALVAGVVASVLAGKFLDSETETLMFFTRRVVDHKRKGLKLEPTTLYRSESSK